MLVMSLVKLATRRTTSAVFTTLNARLSCANASSNFANGKRNKRALNKLARLSKLEKRNNRLSTNAGYSLATNRANSLMNRTTSVVWLLALNKVKLRTRLNLTVV